jgi:hypothetical protein
LNCEDTVSLSFLRDLETTNLTANKPDYSILGCSVVDFLSGIYNLDLVVNKELDCGLIGVCQDIHFGNLVGSSEALLNLNALENFHGEEKFSLLKLIFQSYTNSGSSMLTPVGSSMFNLNFVSIGFFLICVGLFIKLSIAPFHFWSLDVYEGSPNTTTFFLLLFQKLVCLSC